MDRKTKLEYQREKFRINLLSTLKSRGYTLLTDIKEVNNSNSKIQIKCLCGELRPETGTSVIKYLLRAKGDGLGCRTCNKLQKEGKLSRNIIDCEDEDDKSIEIEFADEKPISSYALKFKDKCDSKGYTIYTPLSEIININSFVRFKCKCERERECNICNMFKGTHDGFGCASCKKKFGETNLVKVSNLELSDYSKYKVKLLPTDIVDTKTFEVWRLIPEFGFISTFGRAKNIDDLILSLNNTSYKYTFKNGFQKDAGILVYETFQLPDSELLAYKRAVVKYKNEDPTDNNIDNLYLEIKVTKPSTSDEEELQYRNLMNDDTIMKRTTDMFPGYIFFSSGHVYNGQKILKRPKTGTYLRLIRKTDTGKKKIGGHRVIAFLYHPLPGKENFNDYETLQVNHIDGDPTNNNYLNLEWDSMQHRYFPFKSIHSNE